MTNKKDWEGLLCWFWNENDYDKTMGILLRYNADGTYETDDAIWLHCKPIREIFN